MHIFSPSTGHISTSKKHTKALYDSSQNLSSGLRDKNSTVPVLDKLYIDNFDSEQIWQQIDHRLTCLTEKNYVSTLSQLMTTDQLGLNVHAVPLAEDSTAEDVSDGSIDSNESQDDESENGIDELSEQSNSDVGESNDSAAEDDELEQDNVPSQVSY